MTSRWSRGGSLPEVWVLELSSFQLDQVEGFEPDVATVLNITQDHLDWHGSMVAYEAAKARVFGTRSTLVVNRNDARVESLVDAIASADLSASSSARRAASGKARSARHLVRDVVRFGVDAPQRPGDWGLVVERGMAWLVRAQPSDDAPRRRSAAEVAAGKAGDAASATSDAEPLRLQRLMPADALRVRGRHNAANALAALALATAIGCPLAAMLHALREYRGEPHRVQHVATVDGVDAFDDSKGTNVGATVAALNGLGDDRAPSRLLVILGGDSKGQDLTPLREPLVRHARAIATIGRDAPAVEQVLADSGLLLQRHASLEAATRWCFARAERGDAVLLSPACASLDMFRNYAERAAVFVAAVQAVAAEHGEVAS